MKWSPASWTLSRSQSIHATTPSRIGEPDPAARVSRPSNLSSAFDAKRRHRCSWSALRMLTQNRPARSILGQLVELLSGKKAMSGGSSETEVNDPTTKPAREPSSWLAVTTHTPVGYCPSTWRNHLASVGSPIALFLRIAPRRYRRVG